MNHFCAIAGDSTRGAQLFQTEQCIKCHSVKGKGGVLAPDLARRVDRDYTPAVMASLMWNHAPDMWTAMQQRGVTKFPGLYFLGMNFLYNRKSGILLGVGEDAAHVASDIAANAC